MPPDNITSPISINTKIMSITALKIGGRLKINYSKAEVYKTAFAKLLRAWVKSVLET